MKHLTYAFYGLPDWESEHCIGLNFYYYTHGVSIGQHGYYLGVYLHLWRWNVVVGLARAAPQEDEEKDDR